MSMSKSAKTIFWSYLIGSLTLFTGLIESETLTITTYYPAPYGGYVRILTTDTTILARDGGSVGIGIGAPVQKLDVRGNAYVSGSVGIKNAAPTYDLDVTGSIRASSRIATNNMNPNGGYPGGWGGGVHSWDIYAEGTIGTGSAGSLNWSVNNAGTMSFGAAGSVNGLCRTVYYGSAGSVPCNGGETVLGYFGDGVLRDRVYVYPSGTSNGNLRPYDVGHDYRGWMYCCRIS